MEYLISTIIGYLFGSIPTAYIFLKKVKGLDITNEGSGNVGAMNSFEITNSKLVGILVFIVDFIKGIASVLVPQILFPGVFILPAISLLFAVFSHCYSPWISFKGGRGLATAAGGAAFLFPFLLVVWGVLWVIFYVMRKDILFANISSTVFSILVVFGTSDIAVRYAFPKPVNIPELMLISVSVLMIIFIKHIEPLKELIASYKNISRNKR